MSEPADVGARVCYRIVTILLQACAFAFARGTINLTSPRKDSPFVNAYDPPLVSDCAAQFISLNRRAANLQIYGDWKRQIRDQITAGDAIQTSALRVLAGLSTFATPDRSLF